MGSVQVLGTGMSAKMWEVTIEHARTCVLDKRMYLYYTPGSQQKYGVVFNVVGQVMGILSDCQYVRVDKLSETEKAWKFVLTRPFVLLGFFTCFSFIHGFLWSTIPSG